MPFSSHIRAHDPHAALRALAVAGTVTLCALLAAGCGRTRTPQADQRAQRARPSDGRVYDASRIIVDSMRVDLGFTKGDELLVLSRAAGEKIGEGLEDSFDRVELFRDDKGRPVSVYVDPVENGANVSMRDVTGDGRADLLVELDAGGNDAISSRGLHIYGYDDRGRFGLLFQGSAGDPALQDVDGDGRLEILVSDAYWGLTERSEMIGYTAAIYAWAGHGFEPANERFRVYYNSEIAERRRSYQRLRQATGGEASDLMAENLYRAVIEWMLWSNAAYGRPATVRVWMGEQTWLSSVLPDDLYEDLQGFIEELDADDGAPAAEVRRL